VQAVNRCTSTTFPLIGFLKSGGKELLKLPTIASISVNAGVDLGSIISELGNRVGAARAGIKSGSFAKYRARYRRLKFLTFERMIEAFTIRMNESVCPSGWLSKTCGSWNHCLSFAVTSIYQQRTMSALSKVGIWLEPYPLIKLVSSQREKLGNIHVICITSRQFHGDHHHPNIPT
jgi:hypothetical protein